MTEFSSVLPWFQSQASIDGRIANNFQQQYFVEWWKIVHLYSSGGAWYCTHRVAKIFISRISNIFCVLYARVYKNMVSRLRLINNCQLLLPSSSCTCLRHDPVCSIIRDEDATGFTKVSLTRIFLLIFPFSHVFRKYVLSGGGLAVYNAPPFCHVLRPNRVHGWKAWLSFAAETWRCFLSGIHYHIRIWVIEYSLSKPCIFELQKFIILVCVCTKCNND